MLMREIKQDLNSWRAVPWPWTGRFTVAKRSVFPSVIYKFNAISVNSQHMAHDIVHLSKSVDLHNTKCELQCKLRTSVNNNVLILAH